MPTARFPALLRRRVLLVLGWILLAAVLVVAFLGYLRPQLLVGWEALMVACGF